MQRQSTQETHIPTNAQAHTHECPSTQERTWGFALIPQVLNVWLLLESVLHACRGCAKTHHTTDEAALKQLASLHPLPALVLEFRCMQNILNKWVEPDWVKQIVAANTGTTLSHAQQELSNPTASAAIAIAQNVKASCPSLLSTAKLIPQYSQHVLGLGLFRFEGLWPWHLHA